MLTSKLKSATHTSAVFLDALPCSLLNNFVFSCNFLPQSLRMFPPKRLYQFTILYAFKFLKTVILIIASIRISYLTFNVRVINGRETWPLALREEPRQRVSRRKLTEGWKICIMGCIICGLRHILCNDQIKRDGGGWECNTQEERGIAYIPLFI
jgi:hypothetical protein